MNKSHFTESNVLEFLTKIEQGEIILKPISICRSGNIKYQASNGWVIIVFNDSNTWDYIDSIQNDKGELIGYSELDEMLGIRNYTPPLRVINNIYQIPEK